MSDQGMLLPGQRLRAEREARGMSQNEAARRLNLTVTYVEALEADDYDRLPEAAFVKGYIRNYARELDLPGDELASVYSEMMAEEEEAEAVPESVEVMPSRWRWRWSLVAGTVAVLLAIAVAVVFWLDNNAGTAPAEDAQAGVPPVAEDAGADEDGPVPGAAEPASGTSGPETAPEQPAGGESAPESPESEPGAMARSPTQAPAERSNPATDRLVMTFSAECWLRVIDARGRKLFEGRRGSGTRLSLTGAAPFSIRVGNASAVRGVTINDRDVAMPSGAPGEVVRMSVPRNGSE